MARVSRHHAAAGIDTHLQTCERGCGGFTHLTLFSSGNLFSSYLNLLMRHCDQEGASAAVAHTLNVFSKNQ